MASAKTATSEVRSRRSRPFIMVPKADMERIRTGVEGTDAAFCLSTHVALRWIANNEQCADGPLAVAISKIANYAGCSYNKTAQMLKVMEKLGIIWIRPRKIAGTKSKDVSLYYFHPIEETLDHNVGDASPQAKPTSVQRSDNNRKEQKDDKQIKEGKTYDGRAGTACSTQRRPSQEEVAEFAQEQELSMNLVDQFVQMQERRDWQWVNSDGSREPLQNWQGALIQFCRKAEPPPTNDREKSKDFWEWVDHQQLDELIVEQYIKHNERKGWQMTIEATGESVPIIDYKEMCLRFHERCKPWNQITQ